MSPFFKNRHPRGDLSAYIDGQLKPKRAATTEAHLTLCLECSAELAELRELRSALGSMPEVTAPRSFTLAPEQVAQTVRTSTAQYRPTPLVTGLRLGSAGLAMALAVVVAIDAGVEPGDPGRDDAASEMQALATATRSLDDNAMLGEDYEADTSPQSEVPGAAGAAATTPTPNVRAPDETSTPARSGAPIPTNGDAIPAYDDDGSKGADDLNGPTEAIVSTAADNGDNDLLVIEIILGITAAVTLLVSVFVARSRGRSI